MIFFERFRNGNVHIAELTAVAFVKDNDDVLFKNGVYLIFFNELIQFLNGRDDDPRVRIFQLSFQNCRGSVAVCRPFLKAVVFLHRLVVEIFSVNHKQNLVDIRERGRKLRGFERSERFSATRRMPDISAAVDRAVLFVVIRNFDFIQNLFRRGDLVCRTVDRWLQFSHANQYCQAVSDFLLYKAKYQYFSLPQLNIVQVAISS